jgi:hypothetical protein
MLVGSPTLWLLDWEKPAALVEAAARLEKSRLDDLEAVRRGLRRLARLEGWPGRLASYLLARPEALRRAVLIALHDGGALKDLVEEVLSKARGSSGST